MNTVIICSGNSLENLHNQKGNIMKKLLALLIISCMLMTALASCDWFGGDDPVESTTKAPECPGHFDGDGDYICDNCGKEFPRPDPSDCPGHKDDDGDKKCDICLGDYEESIYIISSYTIFNLTNK